MIGDWRVGIFASGKLPPGYVAIDGGAAREELLQGHARQFWTKSEFSLRAETPFTTSYMERQIRSRLLARATEEFDRGGVVLELGCGDGLVTRDLLSLGFERLVASEILPNLASAAWDSISAEFRERVCVVVDDVLEVPFLPAHFPLVVAWGVLSVCGHFERALERAWAWVRPGGALLIVEPLLEHALVYALVRGDFEEFARTLAEGTRPEMWDKRDSRYPLWTYDRYSVEFERLPGGHIEVADGVNMLPSLVFGGLLQDQSMPQDVKNRLQEALLAPEMDKLRLWRQALWLIRKADNVE